MPSDNGDQTVNLQDLTRDVWLLKPMVSTLQLYLDKLQQLMRVANTSLAPAAVDPAQYVATMEPQLLAISRIQAYWGIDPTNRVGNSLAGYPGLIRHAEHCIAGFEAMKVMLSTESEGEVNELDSDS